VTGIPRQFIPMHKGAGGFMSDEQFAKFYWPTFKALIEACVAAGITPMPLFEGDYTPRLDFLAELPPGKVAAHFDRVDRKKFKEVCGDVLCFWGNVPSSLLVTGTPQQVKDDVKELIDLFGETGLILDGPGGIPDQARPENVEALAEAVEEFGVL
jgi:uroporphyrinogen-III decarboxylase